jgi:hypothetical protein
LRQVRENRRPAQDGVHECARTRSNPSTDPDRESDMTKKVTTLAEH